MMAPQKFMGADCDPVALPARPPTWREADVVWQKPGLRAGVKAWLSYLSPYLIIAGCAFFFGCIGVLVLVAG